MIYDIAVIGLGMIGAAATRYLSASGLNTLGIGPTEPENWSTHQGVFASHYDAGRITRILDKDLIWATLAARSIDCYAEIEAQSGIPFHGAVGLLRIGSDPTRDDTLADNIAIGQQLAVDFSELQTPALRQSFPFLHFPDQATGLWERGGAGYVEPRRLVQAQLAISAKQEATLVRQTVTRIERKQGVWQLYTDGANQPHRAERILLSSGSWSSSLLPRPLAVALQLRTVLLAQLDADEVARLSAMPSLIWRLGTMHPDLLSVYSTPPLPYPDGSICFKIGGVLHQTQSAQSTAEVGDWFRKGGDPYEADALQRVLLSIVPGLRVVRWQHKPCVYTTTATNYPYIDQVDETLFIATGGCGSAAKSSNEIGRLGALLAATGQWEDSLPRQAFQAKYN